MPAVDYEALRPYAQTDRQREILDALKSQGSYRKAATFLGLSQRRIPDALERVRKQAAAKGYAPEHDMKHPAAPGFAVKGTSTLYNAEGQVAAQWVKTRREDELRQEAIKEAVAAFIEDVPQITASAAPKKVQGDIIPWVQIGDGHIGLLCQFDEVGADYDLKIGERELTAAVFRLIDEAPDSERIVINDLGDGTHYSNFAAISNNSGHAFDFDSRYPKMIRVYSRILRACITRALTKAKHVDVIINQGNHSRENDIWAAELVRVAFEHTGRVHVLNNDSVFIGYRMGKTFVLTHHSDKCKPKDLAGVLITDFRQDFGETDYHYIDIGHVHHSFVSKEYPSIVLESWNHLPATDRWAHDLGYRARKSITMVYRSKTYGEVGRRVLPLREVQDILDKLGQGREIRDKVAFTV